LQALAGAAQYVQGTASAWQGTGKLSMHRWAGIPLAIVSSVCPHPPTHRPLPPWPLFSSCRYLGPQGFDPRIMPLMVDTQCDDMKGSWVQGNVRINTGAAFAVSAGALSAASRCWLGVGGSRAAWCSVGRGGALQAGQRAEV